MKLRVIASAVEQGWELNPDERIVDLLVTGLTTNESRHGSVYCPCSLDRIPEMVCPCVNAEEDIIRHGHCNCGLFYEQGDDHHEA